MTPMEAALSYAEQGWAIFPCHSITLEGRCTCGKMQCDAAGKHPRTLNGVKDATTDPDKIHRWFEMFPESNIGLACGEVSNVFAVDIDAKSGGFSSIEDYEAIRPDGPLPATLTSISGSGGRHLIYRMPHGMRIPNRIGWIPGVDIRGDNGYIIVPPSRHVSGGKYRWLNETTVSLAPSDLVNGVQVASTGSRGDLPETSQLLQGVSEGKRDDIIFRAACRWRRQLKDKSAVTTLVLEAARHCDPPFPEDQALRKIEQAFKQDHSDEDDDDEEWEVPTDEDGRHLTDYGNAQRMVDAYGDELIFVEAFGWMIWSGHKWKADDKNVVMRMAGDTIQSIYAEAVGAPTKKRKKDLIRWATASESAGHIQAMVTLAKADERIARSVIDFDNQPYLFTCSNGIINLRTGELLPHSREYMVTRTTDVAYEADYKFPMWDEFLDYATYGDKELQRYLQMAAGYTLTASTQEECLFIIHGPAASGKSTFIDGLMAAMGEYSMVTQAETFLNRRGQGPPKDELARFYGARLVATIEVPEGERFAEALVKQLTGGDKIAARQLYKQGFDYTPDFKLWFGTNHAPRIQDEAIWRRIKKIPFIRAVPPEERNPALKAGVKNIETGAKRVLAWAVEGALMWQKEGKLLTPSAVQQETNEYRLDQDKFGAFLEEHCEFGANLEIEKMELYGRYQAWCFSNGEKPMTSTGLTTKLKSRFDGFRVARRGAGKTYYVGLTTKEIEGVNFAESYGRYGL